MQKKRNVNSGYVRKEKALKIPGLKDPQHEQPPSVSPNTASASVGTSPTPPAAPPAPPPPEIVSVHKDTAVAPEARRDSESLVDRLVEGAIHDAVAEARLDRDDASRKDTAESTHTD